MTRLRLHFARSLPALGALILLAACGGRVPPPAGGPGAPLAPAAVERMLQLASARDYVQMGWVFGTQNGPVIEQYPLPEVEKRMYALAHILQHDSYVIGSEMPVPGRIGSAVRFHVNLTRQARQYSVPFIVVRAGDGRWYVEQLDVEAITNVR